jgi:PIN domain nuclease of toxin-antitoxin system
MNEWLLDTGVLLWWLADDPRLSPIVRTRIKQSGIRVYVSVATAWEIASLACQGRLDFGEPPEVALPREVALHRFLWLPLEARHVLRAQFLPRDTLDPYDRLLVAQAALEGLSIVTTNARLVTHGVSIVEAMARSEEIAVRRPRREPGRPIRMGGYGNDVAAIADAELPGATAARVRPALRPVRRSGDELKGEEHADPLEPRTITNPAGVLGAEPGMADASVPCPARAPDSALADRPSGAVQDIVLLRPVPRWNAFPWGGMSGGGGDSSS